MMKISVRAVSPDQIPCLLLPNKGFRLILPNTTVAEIISWQNPQPQHTANSDWVLGFFEWREKRLPLLSIHISGQVPNDDVQPFTKIAVLNAVSDDLGFSYYGVALSGTPKLVRVDREDISTSESEPNHLVVPEKLSLQTSGSKVMLNGEEAWLPNLDEVEQQVTRLFR
ncbi:MAG: chemotaxis protein CheW [Pseudomonadales bacterium]|nr:chemotaxis protein CheW [Pseudomonadales bacterium]